MIDLGDGAEGFEKVLELWRKNSETMREVNPLLAQYLMYDREEIKKYVPVNI